MYEIPTKRDNKLQASTNAISEEIIWHYIFLLRFKKILRDHYIINMHYLIRFDITV